MDKPRVAIIGASGIGRHHARWYHTSGAAVIAFAGTSQESCERTAALLRESLVFTGRGYWDLEEMLERERPDVVAVCSPPQFHHRHVLAALDAGAHVLCEKPLACDFTVGHEEWLAQGRDMVGRASSTGRFLGMTPQLAAAAPFYWRLFEKARGIRERPAEFFVEMRNRSRKGRKTHRELWCDLSPHPLGLLMELVPDGQIDETSLRARIAEHETVAEFDWVSPAGRCAARIQLADLAEGGPVRRFGVNGFLVDWTGYRDEAGVYRSALRNGGAEVLSEDFLHVLIRDFIECVEGRGGRVWVDGPMALRNLEALVQVLKSTA